MTRDQLLDQLAPTRERHALDLVRLADVHAAWCEVEDGFCLETPAVDVFSGRAVDQAEAVAVCTGCLMRDECLT